jgi:uncharacterized glyoxalase superfamily protein PhnB
MLSNRFCPRSIVIPVLSYPDVNEAAAWLVAAFGFAVRLRIGDHRIQMNVPAGRHEAGAVILREPRPHELGAVTTIGHSITVRVEDVDAHFLRAKQHGASITDEPTTQPYGERQYVVEDLAGYSWTFSQSITDVHPSEWGATAENLD